MADIISVVMIDSRGEKHPEWVQTAIASVRRQLVSCELIVIKNWDKKKTIGQCWNEGVELAKGDWVAFIGDDDFISDTYLFDLNHLSKKAKTPMVASYMTVFRDNMKEALPYTEISTGMWKKEYLLKYPFNEKLKRGVDREYIDKMKQRGDAYSVSQSNFGYFYRKHDEESCAGDISILTKPKDIYAIADSTDFIKSFKWDAYTSDVFESKAADGAKIIWCDFATGNAVKIADYECDARKFLRVHAHEVFRAPFYFIDFSKFEKVIFVAEHIKNYAESRLGEIVNAVVIPNGVDLEKFSYKDKKRNNKIVYAGRLTRSKGIGELFLIAKSLPEYEFYIAGKFFENDVAEYAMKRKPDNVAVYAHQYDLNEFYQDKTYVINTSLRESQGMSVMEGMACGLKPLVYNWVGSEEVYKPEWVYKDIKDLRRMLEEPYEPEKYRKFIEENYNFENTYKEIEKLLEVKDVVSN